MVELESGHRVINDSYMPLARATSKPGGSSWDFAISRFMVRISMADLFLFIYFCFLTKYVTSLSIFLHLTAKHNPLFIRYPQKQPMVRYLT